MSCFRSMRILNLCLLCLVAPSSAAYANINLELRPVDQTVQVNDIVSLGLYAVSDSGENQFLSAADVIFSWDPGFLHLQGLDSTGGATLLFSGFPVGDSYNLNESIPPQDGDGYYLAFAPLGLPVTATPSGTLLSTFDFQALAETPSTEVSVLSSGGSPPGDTVVWDGTMPNTDITGSLGIATVTITSAVTCNCLGDMNSDGAKNGSDIQIFLDCMLGTVPPPADCNCADMDGINGPDVNDIAFFVAALLNGPACP